MSVFYIFKNTPYNFYCFTNPHPIVLHEYKISKKQKLILLYYIKNKHISLKSVDNTDSKFIKWHEYL